MAKNKLNYLVVLSRVCRKPKDQGWVEETSGTLLNPSNPRESMGYDLHGLYYQPADKLEFYNSVYCSSWAIELSSSIW